MGPNKTAGSAPPALKSKISRSNSDERRMGTQQIPTPPSSSATPFAQSMVPNKSKNKNNGIEEIAEQTLNLSTNDLRDNLSSGDGQPQLQLEATSTTNNNNNTGDDNEGRELASKCILMQQKRFYLDVKQNKRGRFIKVAEVGTSGKKSRILFSTSTAAEFCELLLSFSNYEESQNDFPRLKSERLQRDNRLYYFDLKENDRGRYLRCTQLSANSPGPRSQVTIPGPNILEFRNTLLELLNEFGQDDGNGGGESGSNQPESGTTYQGSSSKLPNNNNNNTQNGIVQLPEGRVLKLENKRYYFDVSQNQLGVYMKISEVKPALRTTVTIPENSWIEFRDMFNECMEKMNELRAVDAS